MITHKTVYICDICKAKYEKLEEAEACYKDCTTCPCEKYRHYHLHGVYDEWYSRGSDNSYYKITLLNFQTFYFELWRYMNGKPKELIEQLERFTYCPYCGKKGANHEPNPVCGH